ncbi:unnamed protein product [Scytosiphon promiscuus]
MRGVVPSLARSRNVGGMIISVLGDTFVDIVCRPLEHLPTWGTDTVVSEPIRVMLGGSAANFAVHATNLGRATAAATSTTTTTSNPSGGTPTDQGSAAAEGGVGGTPQQLGQQKCVLHTSVGSDDMGQFVRTKLDEHGVDWSQTRTRENQGACVVLSGREDRSFITHRGSTAHFCREDIDVPRLLESQHVHLAGFYNFPSLWKDLPGILAEAKAVGASCSLGPQWDASEEWGGLEPLYPYLDVFIPNEVEALNISGCDDVLDAAAFFLDKGVGLVVITRGGDGALAVSKRRGGGGGAGGDGEGSGKDEGESMVEADGGGGGLHMWEQRCAPVEIVDTTGAGDAFSAGFLHTWKATGGGSRGVGSGDIQVALRWGCALGTAVVTRVGACPRLSVEEDVRPNLF